MTWLSRLMQPTQIKAANANWSGSADGWYQTATAQSEAGVWISPDTAMRCGTVYAAVRFLADSVAMCPLLIYQRLERGKKRDPSHYAYQVLHRRPNAWQTSFRWRHNFMAHLALWGNAYNLIKSTPTSFVGELWPLHPSMVRVIDQMNDGSLLYEYRAPGKKPERITQDRMLHFRGPSLDTFEGLKMYELIRNAVGVALAAEKHAASSLKNGVRLSGILTTQMPWNEQIQTRLSESFGKAFGGTDNVGRVAALGDGFDFKPLSMDNQKAQFLEVRDFQVGEILRFLGVPGVVVGFADKTATYASAEAFFEKGGIKHCVLPWISNLEHEIDNALMLGDEDQEGSYFVEFNLDVLLRANTKDRYQANLLACGGPWMTRNEIRIQENMDPGDDTLDEFIQPANAATSASTEEKGDTAQPDPDAPKGTPATPSEEDGPNAIAKDAVFALDAARQVVRREVDAVKGGEGKLGSALRYARDPAAWTKWVGEFYAKHVSYVVARMHVDEEAARGYCEAQAEELLLVGVAAIEGWDEAKPARLVGMALSGAMRETAAAMGATVAAPVRVIIGGTTINLPESRPVVQNDVHVPPAPAPPIIPDPTAGLVRAGEEIAKGMKAVGEDVAKGMLAAAAAMPAPKIENNVNVPPVDMTGVATAMEKSGKANAAAVTQGQKDNAAAIKAGTSSAPVAPPTGPQEIRIISSVPLETRVTSMPEPVATETVITERDRKDKTIKRTVTRPTKE